jgi:hypothetical protein
MKLFLAILAAVIIALTLYADYRWRRWISTRRNRRD